MKKEILALLLAERGLCVKAVVAAIEAGDLLDVLEHPSPELYLGQRINYPALTFRPYAHAPFRKASPIRH